MTVIAWHATWGRNPTLDYAIKSDEVTFKLLVLMSVDQPAAELLCKDLMTLAEKRDGTEADNARRWMRRLNRALDSARYDAKPMNTDKLRRLEMAI